MKEFTARLTELERQINSSIAYDAVENLVSAYGYYLDDSTDRLQDSSSTRRIAARCLMRNRETRPQFIKRFSR